MVVVAVAVVVVVVVVAVVVRPTDSIGVVSVLQ